jgi:hypothetical protein
VPQVASSGQPSRFAFAALTALALPCLLLLGGCGASDPKSPAARAAVARTLTALDASLDVLDEKMLGTYGKGLPVLVDGAVADPAVGEWPASVEAMIATERTLFDFAKTEALAKKCNFSADYIANLKNASERVGATELVALGYRSRWELKVSHEAELKSAAQELLRTGSADCLAQESRVQATSALALTVMEPKEGAEAPTVRSPFHREVLRLAKLNEVAARCAMPDAGVERLGEVAERTQALALKTGLATEVVAGWQKEGIALGQFAFSTWPSVNCDIFRRAMKPSLAALNEAIVALKAAL